MEVIIVPSMAAGAEIVADAIAQLIGRESEPVLGLATGSSPVPVYAALIDRYQRGELSLARATAFTLDEYIGLPPDHPESYRSVIRRDLVDHIDLPADRLFSPDGSAADLAAAARDYDASITAAGHIDLQILGIGRDGHIAFNEPGSSLASRTRLKTLTATTRRDNARFFGGDEQQVPRHVLTQGIATILDAHHLVALVAGRDKAEPIAAAVEGPVTAMVPASALQLHPHVTVVIDEDAASMLRNADYYREVFEHKPDWQHL